MFKKYRKLIKRIASLEDKLNLSFVPGDKEVEHDWPFHVKDSWSGSIWSRIERLEKFMEEQQKEKE